MEATVRPPVHPLPGFGAILREQLRLIWEAMKIEYLAGGLVVSAGLHIYEYLVEAPRAFDPTGDGWVPVLAGFLFPLLVWRGERLFDEPHLATLPVDRPSHILVRALAGAVWLLALLALVLLLNGLVAALFGKGLTLNRTLVTGAIGPDGAVAADALRKIRWTPQAWNWLAPLTLMAVTYLLGTAVVVGVRNRLASLGLLLIMALAFLTISGGILDDGELTKGLGAINPGNLDQGGIGRFETVVRPAGLPMTRVWTDLPDMTAWLGATIFWLVVAGGLLWLAVRRHREH